MIDNWLLSSNYQSSITSHPCRTPQIAQWVSVRTHNPEVGGFDSWCAQVPSGSKLESIWVELGVTLESIWGHFGINLGSLWTQFGHQLGSIWIQIKINWKATWDQFWPEMGRHGSVWADIQPKWSAINSICLLSGFRSPGIPYLIKKSRKIYQNQVFWNQIF